MGRKALTYKEYLNSNIWRCGKSPTNAHYWLETNSSKGYDHTGVFYCKYCGDAKRMPVYWSQINDSIMTRSKGEDND